MQLSEGEKKIIYSGIEPEADTGTSITAMYRAGP